MALLWRMLGYPPPPESITDRQIDVLLDVPSVYYPPVIFSPLVRAELKKHIKANWATRPGQKTPAQLLSEILHDCTQEYMTRLVHPPIAAILGINEDIAEKKAEMDRASSKEDKALWANLIEIKVGEISKLFTEGYTQVFLSNLLFDSEGRPIGVRAGTDREDRFPLCHARLSADDAMRRGPRVNLEADPLRGAGGLLLRSAGGTRRLRRRGRRSSSRRSQ